MGDVVDLQTRLAPLFKDGDASEFEAFLAAEGINLLSAFRSIEDASVRKSTLEMVSKVADALRTKANSRPEK